MYKNSLFLMLNSQIQLMFFRAIGIMSGTSLDGLDIVCSDFWREEESTRFQINAAEIIDFPNKLSKALSNVRQASSFELLRLDLDLGQFIGSAVNNFLKRYEIPSSSVDFIASHGHTVFHQPDKRITCQIGKGQEIARITKIKTINNFREKDVLYGGQGAPLVPIGDRDLFAPIYQTDAFINLGGFANITLLKGSSLRAFDIAPCNLVLNRYAKLLGHAFDRDGALGRIAKSKHPNLVKTLNDLAYFNHEPPKSLGAEWLDRSFYTLLDIDELSAQDKLGISYEVISDQITKVLRQEKVKSALITGGGAKNNYLIELIQEKCATQIIIPEEEIIDFKEALVFAYLGVLFVEGKANCLKEVTSASHDVIGGVQYLP